MPFAGSEAFQLTSRELPVLLTVDVCDGSYDPGDRRPRFRDLMNALPEIREVLGEVVNDGRGGLLPVTWFVRSDAQVAQQTGSAAGLVRGWWPFWEECRDLGGEIGWHPHLYKRHGHGWAPIRDGRRLANEAERIWHDITNEGWRPVSSRMGESVGSVELMGFLDSVGLRTDASALPGRKSDTSTRWFDWKRTPSAPYHPADGDYRRPPRTLGAGDRVGGERPLGLLEIPFTMAGIRAPYDPKDPSARPPKRYVDLSFDPDRLRRGLSTLLLKRLEYLVLVVHPLQAIGREVPEGGLVIGGIDTLRANLRTVLNGVEQIGRYPRLLTIAAFRRLWLGERVDAKEGAFPAQERKAESRRPPKARRTKGGARRTSMERDKAVRGGASPKQSIRGGSRRRRQAPRKRRG